MKKAKQHTPWQTNMTKWQKSFGEREKEKGESTSVHELTQRTTKKKNTTKAQRHKVTQSLVIPYKQLLKT